MSYLIMGSLAFLFFVLYDINSVTINLMLPRGGFFIGCFLLIVATGGIVSSTLTGMMWYSGRTLIFLPMAGIFLFLLIYTLFFALPFAGTYIEQNSTPKTCVSGFYAMSRHPGVLWFIGFYLSLWLALSGPLLLIAGAVFSLLNLLYIILQDRWIFMKAFPDYGDYKKTTPFLIPNYQSLNRCVQSFRMSLRADVPSERR